MSTVNIPAIGAVDKRVAIGIGVATAGAIGFIYWRRSQGGGTAAAGDEVVPFDDGSLTDVGEYGGGAAWQYTAGPTGSMVPTDTEQLAPRTNAEWGQRALEAMVGTGYDSTAAAGALGKYLGNQTMTAVEAIMIRAALGLIGSPPQGVFAVRTSTATAPAAPAANSGAKPLAPTGLRTTATGPTSARFSWNPVKGAVGYRIGLNGSYRETVTLPQTALYGLTRNKRHTITVQARSSTAVYGPAAQITFNTTK